MEPVWLNLPVTGVQLAEARTGKNARPAETSAIASATDEPIGEQRALCSKRATAIEPVKVNLPVAGRTARLRQGFPPS